MTLREPLLFSLNFSGLLPALIIGRTCEEAGRIPLRFGRTTILCQDLFEIENHPDRPADELELFGDFRLARRLGAEMQSGKMIIHGSAGEEVGFRLSGGEIRVTGDVTHRAGCEMSGGLIEILGNAGHELGASSPGQKRGMRGGTLIVHGDAGDRVGQRLRRGMLLVKGNVGYAAGYEMIAGTLFIGGSSGPQLGVGMKRGTILLNTPFHDAEWKHRFEKLGETHPVFLQLLQKQIQEYSDFFESDLTQTSLEYYRGDRLSTGLGELFVRAA